MTGLDDEEHGKLLYRSALFEGSLPQVLSSVFNHLCA
jgi:hypothetical protein